jgi:hypothetical protein
MATLVSRRARQVKRHQALSCQLSALSKTQPPFGSC